MRQFVPPSRSQSVEQAMPTSTPSRWPTASSVPQKKRARRQLPPFPIGGERRQVGLATPPVEDRPGEQAHAAAPPPVRLAPYVGQRHGGDQAPEHDHASDEEQYHLPRKSPEQIEDEEERRPAPPMNAPIRGRLSWHSAVADEGCCDADEPEEVVCQTLVAAMQSTEGVQPCHGPFKHPAVLAKPLRGLDSSAGNARCNTPLS